MPQILYEKDGRIGRITLNRPDVMNAIDDEVPQQLADCVARANADPGVHVLVLPGKGGAFCAGDDLTRPPGTPSLPCPRTSGERPWWAMGAMVMIPACALPGPAA